MIYINFKKNSVRLSAEYAFYDSCKQAGHLNKSLVVISSKPTPVTDSEFCHSQH